MSFSDLIDSITIYFEAFFGVIESAFKLFFNDMPVLFGMRLGYWFLLFGFFSLVSSWLLRGDDV